MITWALVVLNLVTLEVREVNRYDTVHRCAREASDKGHPYPGVARILDQTVYLCVMRSDNG